MSPVPRVDLVQGLVQMFEALLEASDEERTRMLVALIAVTRGSSPPTAPAAGTVGEMH